MRWGAGQGGSLGPCVQTTCTRAGVARSRHAEGSASAWYERLACGCVLVAGDHREASRWFARAYGVARGDGHSMNCILEWVRP